MNKIFLLQSEYVHCHLTGIEVHAQCISSIHQFFQCGHIVLTHQMAEYLRTDTEEIELAIGSYAETTHHEAEELGKPIAPDETSASLLLDGIQAPEREEDVYLIAYSCSTCCQREDSCQFIKIAREGNQ